MYLPNPSAEAGCDTRSILLWSLTDLNSEFSFSKISFHTKVKELNLPYYLPLAGDWIYTFPKGISAI